MSWDKPNADFKCEGITDNERRRRLVAHCDQLPEDDLNYCLFLHNLTENGDLKTRRSRLRRFLCLLWTPKLNTYWNPIVDVRKDTLNSLKGELENSSTDKEIAAKMGGNKRKQKNKKKY